MSIPTSFIYPEKLKAGDNIAVLSPSSGIAGQIPDIFELGLQRLHQHFDLVPVEYPTTRIDSTPQKRAYDIEAAFTDPNIKAIIASIGGDDQIKVLKYLNPDVIKAHPKAFFGYSDNCNLHNFLWNLGIVSYHGGSILIQLARCGEMHPYTLESLQCAFFEHREYEILPNTEYSDEDIDWHDSARKGNHLPLMYHSSGWNWHNATGVIRGVAWGGNLEILDWNLRANRHILPNEAYQDKILYIETSEEMPSATEVYRILMCMGERGLLQQFIAVLVGRPKAWSFSQPNTLEQRFTFSHKQEEAITQALQEYHPGVPVIFNLDFGHTDPQFIIPNGGLIRIDADHQQIFVTY